VTRGKKERERRLGSCGSANGQIDCRGSATRAVFATAHPLTLSAGGILGKPDYETNLGSWSKIHRVKLSEAASRPQIRAKARVERPLDPWCHFALLLHVSMAILNLEGGENTLGPGLEQGCAQGKVEGWLVMYANLKGQVPRISFDAAKERLPKSPPMPNWAPFWRGSDVILHLGGSATLQRGVKLSVVSKPPRPLNGHQRFSTPLDLHCHPQPQTLGCGRRCVGVHGAPNCSICGRRQQRSLQLGGNFDEAHTTWSLDDPGIFTNRRRPASLALRAGHDQAPVRRLAAVTWKPERSSILEDF
jgi:hypothetical protein